VERNRKVGQNPPRVVAPTEEEEEEGDLDLLHRKGAADFFFVSVAK
jgi:hypothetical protein